MNQINEKNIEAWLLDYSEGTLTAEQEERLEAFLLAHPHYQSMLEDFEPVYLKADESIAFADKKRLMPAEEKWKVRYFTSFVPPLLAAAALLAAIVMLFPLMKENNIQEKWVSSLTELEVHIPHPQILPTNRDADVNRPEVANVPEKDRNPQKAKNTRDDFTLPVASPSNHDQMVRSDESDLTTLTSQPQVAFIQKKRYDNYSHHPLIESGSPVALSGFLPVNESKKKNRGVVQSILQSEVARTFIPETLEEDLPVYANAENQDKSQVIYLDLPPAGKKLIDQFLKK